MNDIFAIYIKSISNKFSHAETSEMGYRSDFEKLLRGVFESINVTRIDHDPRSKQGNKPDFVILKNDIPILYIETKDIGISLDKTEKSKQIIRYFGYSNFVLTDYLEFRFYRNGIAYGEPLKIGEYDIKERTIDAISKNYDLLTRTLLDFAQSHKEPIKSGRHLAKIMGGKAQRIRENINRFLDVNSGQNKELIRIYEAIKRKLVHDLTLEAFADMYAQTLVYGLFVARYYDDTPETFSRQEARDLVPASNPFLRHFFDHIAGPNFDRRLSYIVDELCEIFSHADTKKLVEEYMQNTDPIIHFYEDFLKEYDPDLRKKMGAYYTPPPVVNFIVRSVDLILRDKFKIPSGLADTTKLRNGKHKVQILDPAVGTGTFISAAIRIIYKQLHKQKQMGLWPKYVHHDLLPRLHGFELMMAPYTICHLKLSLAFKKTGFWRFHRRLNVYLTNSLEQPGTLPANLAFGFAESIDEEAREAAIIKNEAPIMVIIGNPPYSSSSSNKGKWIENQIKVYKKGLNERKINLDDDYIKFIRLTEHFIEKNKTGVVAMITNNSFIDGITHRQMRKHLLETFDEIYIFNLHGDTKKKEEAPDGGKDKNVFDIQQGVSINIFIRSNEDKKELGIVFYTEIFGERERKYKVLNESNIATKKREKKWKKLNCAEPNFFFVPKNLDLEEEYKKGFKLTELFPIYNSGIQTKRDKIVIQFSIRDMERVVDDFQKLTEEEIRDKYSIQEGDQAWKVKKAQDDLRYNDCSIEKILYRPFDIRYTAYTGNSSGFMGRPRDKTNTHVVKKENLQLLFSRIVPQQGDFSEVFISNKIADLHSAAGQTYCAPLYIYSEDGLKTPNLNEDYIKTLEKIVGILIPEDIFDYIYAVLHSPKYRKRYKELLKIDFPYIPYPKDKKQFDTLVSFGRELRKIHLLESSKVSQFITNYPVVSDSDRIEKVSYKDEKVFINPEQYFGNISETVWNFYIGGYKPAQKWLKDRKGQDLTSTELEHYQKIIVAIHETIQTMDEIDRLAY